MFLIAIFDYFRLLFHRKFYNSKQIHKYQLKQIRKIINYAKKNSQFYRELYKDYPIETWENIRSLPVINKQEMMLHFDDLNTKNLHLKDVMEYALESEVNKEWLGYYLDEYVVGLSSGTSGNKGIYVTPKAMTKRLPGVFLARSGFPLRLLPFRILFLLRVYSQGFDDINSLLVNLKYMSTMANIEDVIASINQNKINILMAPPSFIRQLLPYNEQINVKFKRIMTYAEVLNVEDKEHFQNIFKTKVIEIYQASEGQMASACKYGHLHINEDLVHIDIYNESNELIKQPHLVGSKMIITNLVNYAQPLIRYEMNDMIILDETCECGSRFRRIKSILGRHDDLLFFQNSMNEKVVIYPDLFVRWIIITSDNIREFQVVQKEVNELMITIELLKNDDAIIPRLANKLHEHLIEYDIPNANIHFELGKIEIPKEKNKFKRFIRID